jgi:pseudaminic acid cytidylyltransferase
MNIAIIPARGGSKRIPRKNIKQFAGLPMIAHAIRAARECGVCDRVIVSTDDEEIAAIAREHGAETPFLRPPELANDYAGTMEVVQHAIATLDTEENCCPQYVCCLYATAPFVTAGLLRSALEALRLGTHSYVFTVSTFGFPIQRALRLTADGGLEPMYPEYRFTRSQDLEEAYQDAGQFYWGKTAAWKTGEMLYSPAATPVVVPRHLVQDIDTPEDWDRAEWLYQAWQHSLTGKACP